MSRDDQAAPNPAGPGARLRAARERLGLSVQQVADRLRLNPRVIEGIEADDYSAVGAPVYVRGHLRRVANLVGESESEIEALFRAGDTPKGMPDLTRIVTQKYRGTQQQQRRLGTWPMVLIGLLILLGGLVWWAMQQAPRAPRGTQVLDIPVNGGNAPAAPAPATTTITVPATNTVAPARNKEPPATQAPAPSPNVRPIVTKAAAAIGATPDNPAVTTPAARTAPASTAAAGGDRLALHFKDDSWVEVYDADGSRLYYDVGSAGTVHELAGTGPWRVVLGNGDAVTLQVNGRAVNLSRELRETPNVRLTLDRSGRASEIQ